MRIRHISLAGAVGLFFLLGHSLSFGLLWAQAPRAARPQRTMASSAAPQGSALKAVLEPVNYSKDVKLTDVFFTSVEEGWVAGEHSTILHTADGGSTWSAQVGGESGNQEKPIRLIRFLDTRHGWAIQEGPDRFLGTSDGQNWEELGGAPRGGVDFLFTSSRHGIVLANGSLDYYRGGVYLSDDGGRTWKPQVECNMSTTVNGLAHTEACWFVRLQMLSHRSGYALACDNNDSFAFFRTEDGGRTWNARVLPFTAPDCKGADFSFTDETHGLLVLRSGKTYITRDGGNWSVLLATTLGPQMRFADPQVGWTLWSSPSNWRAARISYSVDGGQHWKASADIDLPLHNGESYKLAFPRRDRAYIIGDHGMVYRYRLVPANYIAANMFSAPLMPVFDTSALSVAAGRVSKDVAQLQSQITAAMGGAAGAASGSAGSVAGGFTQDTRVATGSGDASAQTANGLGANANTAGGFTQDVDTGAPSAPLQSCCAPALQNLQTDLTGFNQAAAFSTSQFRSLNLVVAGFQVVTNLLNQAQQLRASFSALKHAPNLQSASAALQQFSGGMNATQRTVGTGFPDPGGWYATTAASGGFVQDTNVPPGP